MKKILTIIATLLLVFALGTAYGDETQPGTTDTGDKMIRDDDIRKYDHDQGTGEGTFNVVPAPKPEVKGEAPGGVSGDRESDAKPAEKGMNLLGY
jgi:hypothetical protein